MILEKVKKLVASQLNISAEKITEKSKLIEDLGADSLDVVEMLTTLEDEFGIAISDDEATSMQTIGEVPGMINSQHAATT